MGIINAPGIDKAFKNQPPLQLCMKAYVKEAVHKLLTSDKRTLQVILKNASDYKKNPLRIGYNRFVLIIQKKIVPCHIKNALLRTTGMCVGHDACVPHDIYFDPYFTELIELGAGCIAGGLSKIITHEIHDNRLTLGKCALKERTLAGGFAVMRPGAIVNKNSILNLCAELDKETGEGELWSGTPAKRIKVFDETEMKKYCGLPDGNYKEYYRSFKEQVSNLWKDPNKNYLKVQYNGKRLNAGNDWWRARNIIRIFYNGAFIEITRLLPHCVLKTLLLRMVGVKLGKNVRIGKGVVFDHIYCDSVTVEDDVQIDDYSYFDGHEYTVSQTIFGRILVKKGAHLKHHTFVRTGTIIGEHAVIEPQSMTQREIPANEVWGGMPAVFIKKVQR